MKKKIIFGVLIFVATILLTGCTVKSIDHEEFTKAAKEEGMTVSNLTSTYAYTGYIDGVYIAKHPDGWKVEFYEIKDKENLEKFYNNNKSKFQLAGETASSSTESTFSFDNGERYSLTVSDKYKHLCKVDLTAVYVNADVKYKEDVIKFLKKIGY